jgi:hypothetical protein
LTAGKADFMLKTRSKEMFVDDDVSYCDNITGIKATCCGDTHMASRNGPFLPQNQQATPANSAN